MTQTEADNAAKAVVPNVVQKSLFSLKIRELFIKTYNFFCMRERIGERGVGM